jgi:two-component system cell cycle sensor histidine kinase/response regulator CckA
MRAAPNAMSSTTAHPPSMRRHRSVSQIARQVSAAIGEEFFKSLVTNLAEALSADCVYLGEFVGGQAERVRTLAALVNGQQRYSLDYVLAGSVAALVATGEPWSCTRGVLKRFPSDALLCQIGAQACVAVPLLTGQRQASGVMMAVFRNSLDNTRMPKSMLEQFAPRAAAELHRRQSEAALRESAQRYHAFIADNTDGMWRIEFENPISTDLSEDEQIESIYRQGYLAECNDAMARLLGHEKASQLIGTGFEELARYADPRLREDLRSAIRSGYRFDTVETKPVDRNGHARQLLRSNWCVVEDGKLQRIWGTCRDITELKRVEDALQASERRLSELLESMHLLTVMLDADGSIRYCNDYMLQLTGWQAAEATGKNWFDLMVPEDEREKLRAEFTAARVDVLAPRHFESNILGKNGDRWLIAWESTVLSDARGQVSGFASVGRDITVFKAFQEQLIQSQKLESIRHSVDRLVHDFSGLTTIIGGYCEILLHDRRDTDPTYIPLMEIKAAAERGAALTQQLSAFSEHQELRPELLDLNVLIEEVGRTVQLRLPDNITLQIELDPALAPVHADASRLREVLLNLAANAIDAMPLGGRLTIHSTNIELTEGAISRLSGVAPGHYVLLAVADTGVGMSQEVQAHLFEPFFSTKGAGDGLGLSSVYGIVQQSGGHIVVDTQPGIGTIFQIYLPRVQPEI